MSTMLSAQSLQGLRDMVTNNIPSRMQMDVDLQDLIVPAAVTTSALALSYCVYRKMALPAPKGLPRLLSKEVDPTTCERTSIIPSEDQAYIDSWPVMHTACEIFQRGLNIGPQNKCLGWRPAAGAPYSWLTYKEVDEKIRRMGSGFISKGFPACQETFIGIFAQNSVTWHCTMQMCNAYSMILVPLYDTLGCEAVQHILNTTKIRTVIVDSKRLAMLLEYLTPDCSLKTVVLSDASPTEDDQAKASGFGIDIISLLELENCGREAPHDIAPPQPSYTALLCYTSGTTGTPKGAMISHGNIANCCMGISYNVWGFPVTSKDRLISYLPAAHVYEFAIECYFTMIGASIGFYQGNIKLLLDDIQHLQPTVFPSVPRVLNKLYDKIQEDIAKKPALVQWLISAGLASKLKEVELGVLRQNSVWDYLIFHKIRKLLGGKLRMVITGSAPIGQNVLQWYRSVLGCYVVEGYGGTENCGVCTMSLFGDTIPGHVGVPAPYTHIKLKDVPDMNYFASQGKGEVCVKGASVFSGYYNEPEKTAEALTADGWQLTGDIGTWTDNGCLVIIDRKKNIFKLAQGEYIAPEKIEILYEKCPIIAQCFVYGNSMKATLVGLVIPDDLFVKRVYACEDKDYAKLLASDAFNKDVMAAMKEVSDNVLKSFECVKKVHISSELFSVDNGLATPTFKKKRNVIADHFLPIFNELYIGLD